MKEHVARASVKIHARPEKVWDALTNPEMVRRYMMGATVNSNWTAGAPITWSGEMRGRSFEDHGKVLRAERCRLLEYTHYSGGQGTPDSPDNYHTVKIELADEGRDTKVTLVQEGNPTEEARRHSEDNWRDMLDGLRKVVEQDDADVGDDRERYREPDRDRERMKRDKDRDRF